MRKAVNSRSPFAKLRPLMAMLLIVGGALAIDIVPSGLAYGVSANAQFGSPIVVAADSSGGGNVFRLSCPTATLCVTVGSDVTGQEIYSVGTESDGAWSWSTSTVVAPDSSGSGTLFDVSCPNSTTCVAVGEDNASLGDEQEIYTVGTESGGSWSWSTSTVIAPDSSGKGSLLDVNCPSATSCVAVGGDFASQEIYTVGTESGGSWSWSTSAVITPDSSGGGLLSGLSCPTATTCVTVGSDLSATSHQWGQSIYSVGTESGSTWTWSTSTAVAPDSAGLGILQGISCSSATTCVAVGDDTSDDGSYGQSIYSVGTESGGTWSWSTSADVAPDGSGFGSFNDVSCTSTTSCIAVGQNGALNNDQAIYSVGTESGNTWTWTTSTDVPSNTLGVEELDGVACPTASTCVAIGIAGPINPGEIIAYSLLAVPGAPIIGAVEGGNATAIVNWTAPVGNGGSMVAGYTVSADDTTTSNVTTDVCSSSTSSTATSCDVSGITNGDVYTFSVAAINSIGTGSFSGASAAVTPMTSSGAGGGSGGSTGPLTPAPPPSGVPATSFGTPDSVTTSLTTPTTLTLSAGGASTSVFVPAGALPSGTTVSEYPVTDPSSLTPPAGQSYVIAFAVSWQTLGGAAPEATAPISMTITDPNIGIGDSIYLVTSAGLTSVATATVAGTVTFTFTSDPVFLVTATTPPSAKAPGTVAIGFRLRSSTLNSAEHNALGQLATKLAAGDSITVIGYASDNGALAKRRAHDVAAYLLAKVKVRVTIKTVTKTAANKVTVTTTKILTA